MLAAIKKNHYWTMNPIFQSITFFLSRNKVLSWQLEIDTLLQLQIDFLKWSILNYYIFINILILLFRDYGTVALWLASLSHSWCFWCFLHIFWIPFPQSRDMHYRLIVMSKLFVVCELVSVMVWFYSVMSWPPRPCASLAQSLGRDSKFTYWPINL